MKPHVSRNNAIMFMIVISVALLLTILPVSCFAESDILLVTATPMDQPVPVLYNTPTPTLYNLPTVYSQTPVIPVKSWAASVFSFTPYSHAAWISGDQLVSSYASLAKGGNGISYPGGMAAGMGGGDAMGGGGGSGGGGGCGG